MEAEGVDTAQRIQDAIEEGGKQAAEDMSKAISGEDLNALIGSIPAEYEKGDDLIKLNIMKILMVLIQLLNQLVPSSQKILLNRR